MKLTAIIPNHFSGDRLDKVLASVFPDFSRTTMQSWLDAGRVQLNNQVPSKRTIVVGGENVAIDVPERQPQYWLPEKIPIEIVFEDEQLLVINKPAGMVVHPGAGNAQGTLLNAIIEHCSSLSSLPRGGIVHRLDKNTSGLLVVAKTEPARLNLIKQFKSRTVARHYLAITEGRLISGGTIDAPIGRHPRDRRKMTVGSGKPAVSHYRIVSRYRLHTLVRVKLDTGRTHQIRVHFRHAGIPLVGDPEYGSKPKLPAGASDELIAALRELGRQALHAETLEILHPANDESVHWHVGLPEDLRTLILALKRDSVEFQTQ